MKKGKTRDSKGRYGSPTKPVNTRVREKREKREKVLFVRNKTIKRYIFI